MSVAKKVTLKTTVILTGLAASVIAGATMVSIAIGQTIGDDSVIVLVNGEPTRYESVRVRPEMVEERFQKLCGGSSSVVPDRNELARLRREMEVKRTCTRIKGVIVRQITARLGADPTNEEVAALVEQMNQAPESRVSSEKARTAIAAIVDGLDDVAEERLDPKQVYDANLVGIISWDEWLLRVQHESSPERRRLLRQILELPNTELVNVVDVARARLGMEKLLAVVDAELIRTDPEFADHVHRAAVDPSDPKVQERGPLYRDAKRDEWWKQRFREAKVEIKDERFKDAWPPKE